METQRQDTSTPESRVCCRGVDRRVRIDRCRAGRALDATVVQGLQGAWKRRGSVCRGMKRGVESRRGKSCSSRSENGGAPGRVCSG